MVFFNYVWRLAALQPYQKRCFPGSQHVLDIDISDPLDRLCQFVLG